MPDLQCREQNRPLAETGARGMHRRHETENIPTEILRSFVTVLDTGSFTKAATVLALTQSAVSAQMKRLQRLLKDELFTRGTVNVTLTDKGKFAANYARRILALNDLLLQGATGGVRIGLPPLYGIDLLREVAARCKTDGVNVQFYCDSVSNLRKRFEAGHLDVFLDLSSDPSPDAVTSWTESVVWVSAHEFVGSSKEPFHFINWPGSPSEEIAFRALRRSSIRYDMPATAFDIASYLEIVQAALGYGVMAERGVPQNLRICREQSLPILGPMHVGLKKSGVDDDLDAVVAYLKTAAERLHGHLDCASAS
jgi:DNA-binding transcriptional LysR family regulator